MSEENGKKDTMGEELRAIRKVAKALEGLTLEQKTRTLNYVLGSVYEEQRLSDQAKIHGYIGQAGGQARELGLTPVSPRP